MNPEQAPTDERAKFIYGRIASELLFHEKTIELAMEDDGAGAIAVYVFAIILSRFKKSDGILTKPEAKSILCGKGARYYDRLVQIGWLIERADGRVDVWNYAKYNDTVAQIDAAKQKQRKRMQDHRDKKRVGDASRDGVVTRDTPSTELARHGDVPSSSSSSLSEGDQDPEIETGGSGGGEGSPSAIRLRAVPADPMGDYELAEHWARGVTDGSGAKMGIPRRGDLRDLLDVVADHGPPRDTASGLALVCAWLYGMGKTYGEASRDEKRNVFRFRDFVNSAGAKGGRSSSAPPVQPIAPARPKPAFGLAEALAEGERQRLAGEI